MQPLRLRARCDGFGERLQHHADGEDSLPGAPAHRKEGLALGAQKTPRSEIFRLRCQRPGPARMAVGMLVVPRRRRDSPDEAFPAISARH